MPEHCLDPHPCPSCWCAEAVADGNRAALDYLTEVEVQAEAGAFAGLDRDAYDDDEEGSSGA